MSPLAGIALRCSLPCAALAFSVIAHAECTLRPVTPQGNEARVGALTFALGEADESSTPTAWQGPLTAGKCTFDLGIIEQPLSLAADRFLYVPTYSGSVRQVTVVDLQTCSVRWKSPVFSGALSINAHGMTLGGSRYTLNSRCLPVARRQ